MSIHIFKAWRCEYSRKTSLLIFLDFKIALFICQIYII